MTSAIRITVEPASQDLLRVIMDASMLSNRIGIQVVVNWNGNHSLGFAPEVVLTEEMANTMANQVHEAHRAYIASVKDSLKP